MKTLKTIMVVATFLIGGMAMTGCEDGNASNNSQSTTTQNQQDSSTDVKKMDSTEKKQVLDSINALVSQIETVTNEQENVKSEIKTVSKEVTELKGSSHLFDLISWVVAAIALIIGLIALIKLNAFQKRANRHRKDIDELVYRINSLEQKTNIVPARNKSTINSGLSNSEYNSLSSRIYKIERQLEKLNQSSISVPLNTLPNTPNPKVGSNVNEQSGYFGLPTQMSLTEAYFKRLSDTRESDSRFSVEVRNDRAEFRPLEGTQYLNDLKSNDSIKMAIDMQGCAPSEATQMKVVLPGEAKKDGDRWIITKKATIALY